MKHGAAICILSLSFLSASAAEPNFVVALDAATLGLLNDLKNLKGVPARMGLAVFGTVIGIKAGYELMTALKPTQNSAPWWKRALPGTTGLFLGGGALWASYILK